MLANALERPGVRVLMIAIKKSNVLLVPFVILTGSIIILSILVQILLQSSLNDMKSDAAIINDANTQRALSHQVVSSIAADNLAGKITNPPLDSVMSAFEQLHRKIMTLKNDAGSKQLFAKYIKNVQAGYGNFEKVILLVTNADTTDNESFVTLLDKQSEYIRSIDALIAAINGNSNTKVERFKVEELILTLFSLTIVLLEVLFIFLPAIRRIKKQSQQFRVIAFNHSHIIRQPLANIKGLLDIVDVTKLDNETNELFTMITGEAEKLDKVIKENVYNAAEEA